MSYTADEKKVLKKYFTSVDTSIYGLINLPEVIKGSLFSRYSRTAKDVRRLFLDEFFNVAELKGMFDGGKNEDGTGVNVAKAEDFYERILVGYGDDSIAELGSAHIAVENISMLATKAIEEHRIGLSPLEKSTRYVYYDKKVDDEYLYVKPEKIMKSKHGKEYVRVINLLFDTYSKIVRDIQPALYKVFPGDINEKAYKFSIRAKACDIARGLLPLAAKTNMGVMGNGRAFEYLITQLLNDPLEEVANMGREMYEGLAPTMNAFIKRSVNERGEKTRAYWKTSEAGVRKMVQGLKLKSDDKKYTDHHVELVDYDKDAGTKIIASVIFQQSNLPYKKCLAEAKKLSAKKQEEFLTAFTGDRKIRQHKPGRPAEDAYAAFEIVSDWGVYKDLMRHRMMTRHKQLFTNELGYFMPYEIKMTGFEDIYRNAMEQAAALYAKMISDLPQEAQYVVTHGSFCRFYVHANIRALSHMNELRSIPQGHPSYRKVVQDMTKALTKKLPMIGKHFFQFVDYNDYELERLDAFRKLEKKATKMGVKGFEE